MMYQTVAVGIFTNIGAFRGFCHGNPVSLERVQSRDFDKEKARKRPAFRHLRTFSQWQGQKDLNPRHAVLEAMLKFLSSSNFSPIFGICCQPRLWWFGNWCFFDDMLNSAHVFWCSWRWIWIPRFGLWWELRDSQSARRQMSNAQNLRRIKQRKGNPKSISLHQMNTWLSQRNTI